MSGKGDRFLLPVSLILVACLAGCSSAAVSRDGPDQSEEDMECKTVYEHDLPDMGHVRAMCVTPDGRKVVVHEWRDDGNNQTDRVLVIDARKGTIDRTLTEFSEGHLTDRSLALMGGGRSVLLLEPANGLVKYDLATGQRRLCFRVPDGKTTVHLPLSGDPDRFAAATMDGGVLVWEADRETPAFYSLPFVPEDSWCVVRSLGGRDDLLVMFGPRDGEGKHSLMLFNPKSGKTVLVTEKTGNFDVRPTFDGRRIYVFVEENPGKIEWTHVEEWDLGAPGLLRKIPLEPPQTSIGLKLTRDGNRLFLHEYMIQIVIIWDFRQGRFVGVIGSSGGCAAFDITPDGRTAVTFEGPWKDGALRSHKLAVYDTRSCVGAVTEK